MLTREHLQEWRDRKSINATNTDQIDEIQEILDVLEAHFVSVEALEADTYTALEALSISEEMNSNAVPRRPAS